MDPMAPPNDLATTTTSPTIKPTDSPLSGPTPEGAAQAQREAIDRELLAKLQSHHDFVRSVGVEEESAGLFGLGKAAPADCSTTNTTSEARIANGENAEAVGVGVTEAVAGPVAAPTASSVPAETATQPATSVTAPPSTGTKASTKGKGKATATSNTYHAQQSSFSFSGAATTFEPTAAAHHPDAMDTALDNGSAYGFGATGQAGPVLDSSPHQSHYNGQQNPLDGQLAEEQTLEPDEDDSDSALGSDAASVTTSLSESIYNYRREHGRTYHAYKDGKYIFPNDEREADRLDLQHHLLRITYANKLYFSPLDNPRRCLDVGTGTGIWAVDFADEHPECEVVGIDLSPGQPSLVPPNLKFIIDDAEDAWLYPEKFDFIHARLMSGCFSDWPEFIRQAYENLEPGGWLELQDYGLPVRSADNTHLGTSVYEWGQLLCQASLKLGRPLGSDASEYFTTYMQSAGFVDIQVKMFMWPTNSWPKDPYMKELGRWNQVNITEGLEAFCLALLTRGLGWKKEEVDVLVAKTARDLKDRRIHAYFPMPVVYGRKPREGEVW
ncbi:unnamed protein product [Zymoseptoria tritici ST99CH_1A5]|uniref:Methyltransferase domain-containing protein n=1 Tax=Zymoseptoria tritici ST99CH_1A5 TaxID=1276529 RepID=A0A1Y6LHK6_ZYMTR|nr:unnamed protein product [Zymoseptoria tritici ST99CH_1A5]